MRFLDHWATTTRNTRALLTAIGIGVAVVFSIVATRGRSIDDRVDAGSVVGVITSVDTGSITTSRSANTWTYHRVSVELPEGEEIFIVIGTPPEPRVGDRVPLTYETFEDGATFYALDAMEWRLQTSR